MSKSQQHLLNTANELAAKPGTSSNGGAANVKTAPPPIHTWQHLKRQIASASRWLHIYLSMISFAVVFFFSVTGITLNHPDWFGEHQQTRQQQGKVELAWVKTAAPEQVAKLEIVEQLRRTHGIKGALGDFRTDDTQLSLSFKGPGYLADVVINRETAEYELTETRMGLVAIINDLHKGRDTGRVWSWLIDASAILLTVVSLTGMVLLYFVKRRRVSGFILAAVGGVACYLLYLKFVP